MYCAPSFRLGRIPDKLKAAREELEDCRTCPRDCGVNRMKGEMGACNIGYKVGHHGQVAEAIQTSMLSDPPLALYPATMSAHALVLHPGGPML